MKRFHLCNYGQFFLHFLIFFLSISKFSVSNRNIPFVSRLNYSHIYIIQPKTLNRYSVKYFVSFEMFHWKQCLAYKQCYIAIGFPFNVLVLLLLLLGLWLSTIKLEKFLEGKPIANGMCYAAMFSVYSMVFYYTIMYPHRSQQHSNKRHNCIVLPNISKWQTYQLFSIAFISVRNWTSATIGMDVSIILLAATHKTFILHFISVMHSVQITNAFFLEEWKWKNT